MKAALLAGLAAAVAWGYIGYGLVAGPGTYAPACGDRVLPCIEESLDTLAKESGYRVDRRDCWPSRQTPSRWGCNTMIHYPDGSQRVCYRVVFTLTAKRQIPQFLNSWEHSCATERRP